VTEELLSGLADVEVADAMLEGCVDELSETATVELEVVLIEPTSGVNIGPIPTPQTPLVVGFPETISVIVAVGTHAVVTPDEM
jgi:hypothetical protein